MIRKRNPRYNAPTSLHMVNATTDFSRRTAIFFFNATATTEIYTLSLHDALPISGPGGGGPPWSAPSARSPGSRACDPDRSGPTCRDRKSTRLNSSHRTISYAVFCLKKKKTTAYVLFVEKKKQKKHIK